MFVKQKEALDKGGLSGSLLTNLSKAFELIKHDFLIAKLLIAAYEFDSLSLSFIFSYLNERIKNKNK